MNVTLPNSMAAQFAQIVGQEFLQSDSDTLASFQVDGVTPSLVLRPETAEQAAEVVKICSAAKLSLIPCGARSSMETGRPPSQYDLALDMTRVTGIAHYDPGDLTISVNAGTPVVELDRILASHHQFLPLAVPFYAKATVGGAVASGFDSPLRHFYGTARDFLIGAEFIDGTGASCKSGGRVVKNVTGYDFHKLLHGSLGTLALITRLNFRTFPRPVSRRGFLATFASEYAAFEFVGSLADSALQPVVLEVLSPEFARLFLAERFPVASLRLDMQAWMVCVGFEGVPELGERYARDLSALARTAAAQNAVTIHDAHFQALLEILREAPAAMRNAAPQAVVFRFATLPAHSLPLLLALRSFAGSSWMESVVIVRSATIVYLALLPRPDPHADSSALQQLAYFWKSAASLRDKIEFNAALLFGPTEWKAELDPWAHAPRDLELHRKVKHAFDPNGILAPGRFVGGI